MKLYEFDVKVTGIGKSKTVKGLVDTGSTDCACTHEIITTLWARPVFFGKVSTVNNRQKKLMIYSLEVGFDKRTEIVPVVRVTNLPEDICFILGMSILSNCNLVFTRSYLDITWV